MFPGGMNRFNLPMRPTMSPGGYRPWHFGNSLTKNTYNLNVFQQPPMMSHHHYDGGWGGLKNLFLAQTIIGGFNQLFGSVGQFGMQMGWWGSPQMQQSGFMPGLSGTPGTQVTSGTQLSSRSTTIDNLTKFYGEYTWIDQDGKYVAQDKDGNTLSFSSFAEAQEYMNKHSSVKGSAQKDVDTATKQKEAVAFLRHPDVVASGAEIGITNDGYRITYTKDGETVTKDVSTITEAYAELGIDPSKKAEDRGKTTTGQEQSPEDLGDTTTGNGQTPEELAALDAFNSRSDLNGAQLEYTTDGKLILTKPDGTAVEVDSIDSAMKELGISTNADPTEVVKDGGTGKGRFTFPELPNSSYSWGRLAADQRQSYEGRTVEDLASQLLKENPKLGMDKDALIEALKKANPTAISDGKVVNASKLDLPIQKTFIAQQDPHVLSNDQQFVATDKSAWEVVTDGPNDHLNEKYFDNSTEGQIKLNESGQKYTIEFIQNEDTGERIKAQKQEDGTIKISVDDGKTYSVKLEDFLNNPSAYDVQITKKDSFLDRRVKSMAESNMD